MTDAADEPDGSGGTGEDDGPSRLGKGDSPNVAGSDVQQPEIAEGPVEGLEPGEEVARGPWRPPLEVDPPPGYGHPPGEAGDDDGSDQDGGAA
jgi:hypothetical protein